MTMGDRNARVIPESRWILPMGHMAGILTMIGDPFYRGDGHQCAVFLCDCGEIRILWLTTAKLSPPKSCGCLNRQISSMKNSTHGCTKTRLYKVWCGMNARCRDIKQEGYGGRGISVCSEWQKSFEAFRDWSNDNGYGDELQIDRVENNGNYEPSNCRWTTLAVNINNRRNTGRMCAFGENKTMTEWVADHRCKVSLGVLWRRKRHGWKHELALSTPKMKLGGQRK